MTPIYKKNDKKERKNYRGISVIWDYCTAKYLRMTRRTSD